MYLHTCVSVVCHVFSVKAFFNVVLCRCAYGPVSEFESNQRDDALSAVLSPSSDFYFLDHFHRS